MNERVVQALAAASRFCPPAQPRVAGTLQCKPVPNPQHPHPLSMSSCSLLVCEALNNLALLHPLPPPLPVLTIYRCSSRNTVLVGRQLHWAYSHCLVAHWSFCPEGLPTPLHLPAEPSMPHHSGQEVQPEYLGCLPIIALNGCVRPPVGPGCPWPQASFLLISVCSSWHRLVGGNDRSLWVSDESETHGKPCLGTWVYIMYVYPDQKKSLCHLLMHNRWP